MFCKPVHVFVVQVVNVSPLPYIEAYSRLCSYLQVIGAYNSINLHTVKANGKEKIN